jgi:hypothetical protein
MAKVSLVPAPISGQDPRKSVAQSPLDTSEVSVQVGGSIDSVRQEVDDCFADMRTFHNREPDEIMRMCRGHSARLSELCVRIRRVEDFQRHWKPIRERELEPALKELSDQWQNASRLHSVRELDFKMEGGLT